MCGCLNEPYGQKRAKLQACIFHAKFDERVNSFWPLMTHRFERQHVIGTSEEGQQYCLLQYNIFQIYKKIQYKELRISAIAYKNERWRG